MNNCWSIKIKSENNILLHHYKMEIEIRVNRGWFQMQPAKGSIGFTKSTLNMSSKLEWARSREREGLHISERRGLSCRNQSNLLKWLVLYARQFETARSYCLMEQKPKKRSVTQMAGSKSSVLKRNKRKDGAERKAEIQRRPWKTKSKAQNRNEQLQFQSLLQPEQDIWRYSSILKTIRRGNMWL